MILVRADEASRQLFAEWNRRWRLSLSIGLYSDQAGLNSSIHELNTSVGCLPIEYNAMIRVHEGFRRNAKVVHAYAEEYQEKDQNDARYKTYGKTEYGKLIAATLADQKLTAEMPRSAMSRPWPLVEPWVLRRHLEIAGLPGMLAYYRERLKINSSKP